MAFTGRTWSTSETITATLLNTIRDDSKYLKGQAGAVEFEDDLKSDTDNTDDLGTSAKRWAAIYGVNIWANRFLVSPNKREVRLCWEDASLTHTAVNIVTSGTGGDANTGGTGQVRLKVDNDGAGTVRIDQESEQNNAPSNLWTTTKNPYMRVEFYADLLNSVTDMFLGLRQTVGATAPTTEHFAGIIWNGSTFRAQTNDAGATPTSTDLTATITAAARHVLEIKVTSTVNVEFWIDGVLRATHTTDLPAASLAWSLLLSSDGGGAATDTNLTLGMLILQQDL